MMMIGAGTNSRVRCLAVVACCAALCAPLVARAEGSGESAPELVPTPTLWRASTESVELPGSEKMGLLGIDLLFDVNDTLRMGIGSYGAVRGERGGFITLGLVGEARQRLSPNWLARAGLFVGAGGGRGGYTLSGGGLMLRGDVGLSYETGRYGNFGFGVSHVQFPSGVIQSTQPYLQYEYPFFSLLNPGWTTALPAVGNATAGDSAVPARSTEFALVTRTYRIPSSVVRDDGLAQHSSMQLLGVEWLSYLDQHWFLKLESEGAMGGQSNGYMQILAGGGYRYALSDSTAVKLHAGAGPAGGGGVDTGGGLLLDTGIAVSQRLSSRAALELSLGEVRAPSKSFTASSLGVKLNYQFGLPGASEQALSWSALSGFDGVKLRARVVNQTYFKAAPAWRNRSVDQSVSNLGVQLDYFVSPNWFVTGQGLAAYAGDAGAYMTGQVGVGLQQGLTQRWFVEAEALLGAAGGGGLAVGGGLVGQCNVALGFRVSNALSLLASGGRVSAVKGDLRANVAGLALVYQFTGFTHK